MPEGDRCPVFTEHAGRETGVEVLHGVRRDRLEQPELRPPGTSATTSSSRRASGPERRARASTASRTVSGSVVGARRDDLGHVEGVPSGQLVNRVAVRAGRLGERSHRLERQPRDRQSRHAGRGRELSEHEAERDDRRRPRRRGTSRGRARGSGRSVVRARAARRASPRRPSGRPRGRRARSRASSSRTARATASWIGAGPRRPEMPPVAAAMSHEGAERGRCRKVLAGPPKDTGTDVRPASARTSVVLPTPASPPTNTRCPPSRSDADSASSNPSRSSRHAHGRMFPPRAPTRASDCSPKRSVCAAPI